jgi:hypothetical protein
VATFPERIIYELREQASSHYQQHMPLFEAIKNGIEANRIGLLALADITNDKVRLNNRIEREGMSDEKALERINGVPNFQDISVIRRLADLSHAVCRIVIRTQGGNTGYGTGFLVAPGIILTNNHIFPNKEIAATSTVQFRYELSVSGDPLDAISCRLNPERFFVTSSFKKNPNDNFSGLDFTFIGLDERDQGQLVSHEFFRLDGKLGKIIEGENCIVIQHPNGDFKKIVLKDIRMLGLTDQHLMYESDTLPGSSGSPVIGLGTGELVALHHSAIPRKDAKGRWLRKDGKVATGNESDIDIDWIGNEGIRVSKIVEAITQINIEDKYTDMRTDMLNNWNARNAFTSKASSNKRDGIIIPNKPEIDSDSAPDLNASSVDSILDIDGKVNRNYKKLAFHIELKDNDTMVAHWDETLSQQIDGLISNKTIFANANSPELLNMRYVEISSRKNIWELAQMLEQFPHVANCVPDLEVLTDIGIAENENRQTLANESLVYDSGYGKENEKDFLEKWGNSKFVTLARAMPTRNAHRWWNHFAIENDPWNMKNLPGWKEIFENIGSLRIVQFDTGYSTHGKILNHYDLNYDYDLIDGDDDSIDEEAGFFMKMPGHGGRTASVVVGSVLLDYENDGNTGLLTNGGEKLLALMPFRIAQSVILIGRAQETVAALNQAIRIGADVVFMCMGSYPRPVFARAARHAYESGVIWVCAAGNQVKFVIAPACYPGTIAVAAINPDDKTWKGSSRGAAVDIAAPGEDVYVPTMLKKPKKEIMAFGSGTSYATPHIASAAMLWKAKNKKELDARYNFPWQVVEAFRQCLKASARKPDNWDNTKYGAGVLNLPALLKEELPNVKDLKHAYTNHGFESKEVDIGLLEVGHFTWNNMGSEIQSEESAFRPLTERGKQVFNALKVNINSSELLESLTDADEQNPVLHFIFNQ